MRSFDLSPLFRSTIGFDRLADMLDSAAHFDTTTAYPPYNIERTDENHYRISLAVAGFGENDLNVEVKEGVLTVSGKHEDADSGKPDFLYQGIAARAFERRFQLAENVHVRGASMANGLLHIDLERVVPEEQKPRRIAINGASVVEAKPKAVKAA